jgi:hypothetical protein
MTENESKCHEETEHEHPDFLALALLAIIFLFAARYIIYPYIVVRYIIPYITSALS